MKRTEEVELTVLCLVEKDNRFLLQNRVKDDWRGFAMPGGHIEPGESIIDAVVRELLDVMLNDNLTEFQYVIEDDEWKVILK